MFHRCILTFNSKSTPSPPLTKGGLNPISPCPLFDKRGKKYFYLNII